MSWQRRLLEIAAAGGALASLSGCPAIVACGNANPDPCICDRTPASAPQCVAEKACEDNGGQWDLYPYPPPPDAAGAGSGSAADQIQGRCVGYPQDAGLDAPHADGAPHD